MLALLALLAVVRPGHARAAEFAIAPGSFSAGLFDAEGNPLQLAGAHPDHLSIHFGLELGETTPRDLAFELPPGLAIDAAAVPTCSRQVVVAEEECPPESRVGSIEIAVSGGQHGELPLFAEEALPGEPVSIAGPPSLSLPVAVELRPDFGITVALTDLSSLPIEEGRLELWGVPADHQTGTSIPRKALLSAPSECGPLSFGFRARSQEEEAPWLTATAETPPLTGCQALDFEPALGFQLSDPAADSPTGLRVDLTVPQNDSADGQASAQVKEINVTMPPGISISPGGVAPLSVCSDAQLGLDDAGEAHCPVSSRIGSVELFSPGIEGAQTGAIYLGQGQAGQRLRIFVVSHVIGTTVKFAGALGSGSTSGPFTTSLHGLPPLSFSQIVMNLEGGPAALFATPLTCGPISARASFVPYGGGPAREASAKLTIGPAPPSSRCSEPPPFSPRLSTVTSTHRAGRPVSISTTVSRAPGEQLPSGFSVTMPAGLVARLGSIQACPPASIESASCPAASRMGSVLAQVGSGPDTVSLPGGFYLTGPYRGSPIGALIELGGRIGPFDLGTVALRGGAKLDPRSGRLTVSTDSLPAAVEGVSIRFRSIRLSMDRPGLLRNPTSCRPNSTEATLQAQGGAIVEISNPFRTVGCRRLGFRPAMRMTLFGRRELHRHGRPGLRTVMRTRPGDANLRALDMALPSALGFAAGGMREICSRRDAIDLECPPGSRIGGVDVNTALLGQPLAGSLFVVQPHGDGLPDVSAVLRGGGLEVSLTGKQVRRKGRLALEMSGISDVPMSSLVMTVQPGGAFSLRARPCKGSKPRHFEAPVAIEAQNGARRKLDVQVGVRARCERGAG